ncbi:hypothetical protein M431DRAFT_359833 [Trichoderma harzianum CBS 226.95]|uniref:Uncharacterized protein n=1 Tax=Trichoderma harzianum CBS 226.95 TaxID=983964 RepID=A0A2T4AMP9_TRIHA|nr:hypothetical protein M431DRAFT_359833 [Trichoderma harzianum CBS 226.95]PTB58178.1 hypothetical protein M431DRAFT_359833 [Trichoderma harzianum CBS 226.95]
MGCIGGPLRPESLDRQSTSAFALPCFGLLLLYLGASDLTMPACFVRGQVSRFRSSITQAWNYQISLPANLSRGAHGFGDAAWDGAANFSPLLDWIPPLDPQRTHPATLVVGDSWILRPSAVGSPADTGAMEPRPFPPLLIASSIFAVQSAVNVSTTLSGSMSWPLHSPSRVAHVIANPAFNLHLDIASPGNWVKTPAASQRPHPSLSCCVLSMLWYYGSY